MTEAIYEIHINKGFFTVRSNKIVKILKGLGIDLDTYPIDTVDLIIALMDIGESTTFVSNIYKQIIIKRVH